MGYNPVTMPSNHAGLETSEPIKKKRSKTAVLLVVAAAALGTLFYAYVTSTGFLVSKMKNGDTKTRRWAVDQLIEKGGPAGETVLRMALDQNEDMEMRRLAVFVLGEIGYKKGRPELIGFFKKGPPVIRRQAAYALGRLGDKTVLPELVSAYPDAAKGLKIKILVAIGELGQKEGLGVAQSAAQSEDENIRVTAEFVVEKIREKNRP